MEEDSDTEYTTFNDMGLDDRILKVCCCFYWMGVVAGLAQLAVDTRGEADLLDRRLSNDTPNPGGGTIAAGVF